ncbi:MAG: MopE-related protein [Myxococcota bacterium]|nr:MopE-related protein [Myxococcota bacterium]
MRYWLLAGILLACEGGKGPEESNVFTDADGDGIDSSVDCDDNNALVSPEVAEICDGIDNDCDGAIDDADSDFLGGSTYYADVDQDGYGDVNVPVDACDLPAGYSDNSDDCNDGDALISPDAEEVCDGIDNDCDMLIDDEDSISSGNTYYADSDNDGYGDADNILIACERPETGYVDNSDDCDDTDDSTNPDAIEVCGGGDDNCDGLSDEDDPGVDLSTQIIYYIDNDGDGYGSTLSGSQEACSPPNTDYVEVGGDCNDANSEVNPGATEVCDNGIDNNCDNFADDDDQALDTNTAVTYYEDLDGDGFGTTASSVSFCSPPDGYVANASDCNDSVGMGSSIYPGAPETCDGYDNDCDGQGDQPGTVGLVVSDGSSIDLTTEFTGTSNAPATPLLEEDGVLNLCTGTYYINATVEADVELTSSGGSVVLDGGNQGTVILIDSSSVDVTIDGVTIQNGDGTGGGLSNATRNGGGVHCDGFSSLTVSNAIFTGNTAGDGSDYGYGGGIASVFCDVAISDSEFTGNTAGSGGAVFVEKGDLSLNDTTFNLNQADDLGGAILVDAPNATSTFSASSISLTNNTSDYGGAMSLLYVDSVVTSSTFDGNLADTGGGALHVYSGSFAGDLLTVENNDAGSVGGAVFIGSGYSTDPVTTSSILDSAFVSNSSGLYGGAFVYLEGTHSIENTLIMSNDADTLGGGLFIGDNFDDNGVATNVTVDMISSVVTDNTADFGGALMVQLNAQLTCSGTSSEVAGVYDNGNTGTSGGGVVYLYDTAQFLGNSCDMGSGSTDNNPADIYSFVAGSNTDYGDDATFNCSGSGCN